MNWEIRRVSRAELEDTLQKVPAPWQVFAILPSGPDASGPLTGEYFLIVLRRKA